MRFLDDVLYFFLAGLVFNPCLLLQHSHAFVRERPVYQTQRRLTFAHAISDIQLFLASASLTFQFLSKTSLTCTYMLQKNQAMHLNVRLEILQSLSFIKIKTKACRVKNAELPVVHSY